MTPCALSARFAASCEPNVQSTSSPDAKVPDAYDSLRTVSGPVELDHHALVDALAHRTENAEWRVRLAELREPSADSALHLAVMQEPFLTLLLQGRKTIESRFSVNRVSPYNDVRAGDVLAIKAQSGPVVGIALVEHVAFYELEPAVWRELQDRFAGPLCADEPEFWHARARARFATLMRVTETHAVPPLAVAKRDRRGWVRLRAPYSAQQQLSL